MNTAQALNEELEQATKSLKRHSCGAKAVLKYEPGCTYIICLGCKETVMSMPDWAPTEITQKFNQQQK